jgi:heme/copper-type cytochrome/quinol oxidase subunit 2
MIMLLFIAAVVFVIFGLFVWRYEATTGGTGGIVKLLHDRLLLRLRHREASKREN